MFWVGWDSKVLGVSGSVFPRMVDPPPLDSLILISLVFMWFFFFLFATAEVDIDEAASISKLLFSK